MPPPDTDNGPARVSPLPRRTPGPGSDAPDAFANLDELAVAPVENPDGSPVYEHHSLEEARPEARPHETGPHETGPHETGPQMTQAPLPPPAADKEAGTDRLHRARITRAATHFYTLSYLVFFALWGTLARLGLTALTSYPGTPVAVASLWPNFAGSLVMGFLAEDRMLFRRVCAAAAGDSDDAAAQRAHLAAKKSVPLYIGLATGFCGCFTSFSAFLRDVYLALANDSAAAGLPAPPRSGGYSFLAVLAVVICTVGLSLAGLLLGAHLALALAPLTPALPHSAAHALLDRLAVLLGWGCWLGAVLLAALPPDRGGPGPDTWRGRAVFSLVFAPLGCLARFYVSLSLNGRWPAFPLGTFAVNVAGTLVLAMAWDLAHVPLGGVVGCQVLQGVEDGFCGCLTTVSTWVAELAALRRRSAYVYGGASILAGLAAVVAVMGGLQWSDGFAPLQCVH